MLRATLASLPSKIEENAMSTDQVELERTTAAQPSQRAESGVKTILLHVQNDKSLDCRFETALSLARA